MRKFSWVVLLVLVLVGATVTGCGGKAPEKVATRPTSNQSKETSSEPQSPVKSADAAASASKTAPIATTPANADGTPAKSIPAATADSAGPAPAAIKINSEIQKQIQAFAAKQQEKGASGELRKDDLKKILLGFHNVHDVFKHFPALNGNGEKGVPQPGLSWRVYLLPYIDGANLYQKFKLDEPWDSEHNKALIPQMPKEFGKHPAGKTRLHVLTGKGAPFQNDIGLSFQDVKDGFSNTILCVVGGEATAEIWTKPGGLEFNPQEPLKCLGNIGAEFLVAMMDGRVLSLPATVKPDQFALLVQHADGMAIDPQTLPSRTAVPKGTVQTGVAAPITPLAPASHKLDLNFIPSDAFAALVLHPRRIFEHPVVQEFRKLLPDGPVNFAKLEAEWGLPPLLEELGLNFRLERSGMAFQNIDEIVVLLDRDWPAAVAVDLEEPAPPIFGVVVRNSAPLKIEALLTAMWAGDPELEVRDYDGISTLFSPLNSIAFAVIDDSTLIFGAESFVKKMLAARDSTAPSSALTKRLHDAGNRLLVLAVDAAAIEKAIKTLLKQAPPMITPFAAYIADAKELALSVDLDAPELLQLNLQLKTPELAQSLFGMAEQFYHGAKEQHAPLIREQMTEDPVGNGFLTYFDQLVAETKLVHATDTISLTVPKLKNLDKLPDAFKPAHEHKRKLGELQQHHSYLSRIGNALHNYHDANQGFPALNGPAAKDAPHPGLSWRVYLLPYLDESQLFREFNLDEPWDSAHNKPLILKMPKVFGENKDGKTSIHVLTGPGTPFQNGEGTKFASLTDGTSNTIAVVEVGDDVADIWTKPSGLVFDPKDPLKCLGTTKVYYILLFDGLVRRKEGLSAETFSKLVQYQDGQFVELP
ncbi:MAG: hypothetical protein JWM11_2645 [Planctomycetaceae bacterium]|nr:hypothetical protein [Planctomycetaceae bacterium]